MTKSREKWFLRWVWIPIHWKGWVFIALMLPMLALLIFLVMLRVGPNMALMDYVAVGGFVIAALAMNIFMFRKS